MALTVSPRMGGGAGYPTGFDLSWPDLGEDEPTLTLDVRRSRKVHPDGRTISASPAAILERRIRLRLASAVWPTHR